MNTLQSHTKEFENGIVTETGFAAISDAERYGAASSIGAGSVYIQMLWQAYCQGKSLSLYCNNKSKLQPSSESELAGWCENNFPDCYGEYLRREKH